MTSAFQTLQARMQTALLLDQAALPGLFTPRGDKQFAVYLNAYRARLRGALRDNFETLPRLMGDEAFETLANAYISANPSQHYSLRWFGHLLPSFMRAHADLSLHPAMLDFAQLEWAMRQAFDASDRTILTAEELRQMPGDQWAALHFGLHPSVQILSVDWTVGPIWLALRDGAHDVPEPRELKQHILVWRQDLGTRWASLNKTEFVFFSSLLADLSFGELCEKLDALVGADQAAASASTALLTWVNRGALTRYSPNQANHISTSPIQMAHATTVEPHAPCSARSSAG